MEGLAKIIHSKLEEFERAGIDPDPWKTRTEVATEQEAALSQARGEFGPMSYTENHLTFRLVGYYTKGHECIQAIGSTWHEAMQRLKEKSLHPAHARERGRKWPWRSTLITR